MDVNRELDLQTLLTSGSSVLLLGPRGVGKTALAKRQNSGTILSLNLLSAEFYQRYLRDPRQLELDVQAALQRKPEGRLLVFIDEIQKIPSLLDAVHLLYEEHRDALQFLLTGSSARKLRRSSVNLLAGRLLGLHLHPFTCREFPMQLEDSLRLGSLPGVVANNPNPEATLRSYVHLYLKEEVLEESLVRKVDAFSRFLELAGQYHGEPINASSVARAAGISPNTVSEYFQILEDTLMVFRLSGWAASTRKQLRTAPKYYLFDNGVAQALRGELKIELSPRTSRFGQLFECRVIQEVFRINDYRQLDLKFHYWQANTGAEVDLVVSRGAGPPLAAIEIKSGAQPTSQDWKGLHSFKADYPDTPSFCFCRTPLPYRSREDGVEVLPWEIGLEQLSAL